MLYCFLFAETVAFQAYVIGSPSIPVLETVVFDDVLGSGSGLLDLINLCIYWWLL